MNTLLRLCAFVLVLSLPLAVRAQVTPVTGWSYFQSDHGIVMTPACGGGDDIVALGIFPAETSSAPLAQWLDQRMMYRAQGWSAGARGKVLRRSQPAPDGAIFYQTIEIEDRDGRRWSVLGVAAAVGAARQLYAILMPASADDHDPRFELALAHIVAHIQKNFVLAPSSIAQVARPRSPPSRSADSIAITIDSNWLFGFTSGTLNTASRPIIIAQSGRAYQSRVGNLEVQGEAAPVGWDADAGYFIEYGDGRVDRIPEACSQIVSAAPPQPAPALPQASSTPTATGRNCRPEVKEMPSIRYDTYCNALTGCTRYPVESRELRETGRTICD